MDSRTPRSTVRNCGTPCCRSHPLFCRLAMSAAAQPSIKLVGFNNFKRNNPKTDYFVVWFRVSCVYLCSSRALSCCYILATILIHRVSTRSSPLPAFFSTDAQSHKFHHIEFWCGDAQNTAARFGWALGMSHVAQSNQVCVFGLRTKPRVLLMRVTDCVSECRTASTLSTHSFISSRHISTTHDNASLPRAHRARATTTTRRRSCVRTT